MENSQHFQGRSLYRLIMLVSFLPAHLTLQLERDVNQGMVFLSEIYIGIVLYCKYTKYILHNQMKPQVSKQPNTSLKPKRRYRISVTVPITNPIVLMQNNLIVTVITTPFLYPSMLRYK